QVSAQSALSLTERWGQSRKAHLADDHQVDVTGGVLLRPSNGSVNECAVDLSPKRRQDGLNDRNDPGCLFHDSPQFSVDGGALLRPEINTGTFPPLLQDACVNERRKLPL